MPQVLKQEVRERILASALEVFAAQGYPGATMGDIARHAGLGTASLYRYYPGKDELFDAVVPEELARRFGALLARRVEALARATLAGGPAEDLGGEMLRFWLAHRLAVVILLDRAAGTPHERYGEEFVARLTQLTLAGLHAARPEVQPSPAARFVLARIFENTRRILASILGEHADERAMTEAIEGFWSYQIAGLRAFVDWMTHSSAPAPLPPAPAPSRRGQRPRRAG